jgi:hypothetical protein
MKLSSLAGASSLRSAGVVVKKRIGEHELGTEPRDGTRQECRTLRTPAFVKLPYLLHILAGDTNIGILHKETQHRRCPRRRRRCMRRRPRRTMTCRRSVRRRADNDGLGRVRLRPKMLARVRFVKPVAYRGSGGCTGWSFSETRTPSFAISTSIHRGPSGGVGDGETTPVDF